VLTCIVSACNQNTETPPDVSNIKIDLRTRPLYKELARLDTAQLGRELLALRDRYPDFLVFYLDTFLGYGNGNPLSDTNRGLRSFLTHPDYKQLSDTILARFTNTKSIDQNLAQAFAYYKYYFPEAHIPQVIYVNAGLNNYAAFTYGDDILAIGLDMYLGPQFSPYAAVGLPSYTTRRFLPEYIPVRAMQTLYRAQYPLVMEDRSLLDIMIQLGKEQLFLARVLPDVPDSVRIGFTTAQLDWCAASEKGIYNYFVQKQLLYEKSWQQMIRYVNDGPTTPGMPKESPGNIGAWMGYQIVKAYATNQSKDSLQAILRPGDPAAFLASSRYKPR
jgi:hypothetical protein